MSTERPIVFVVDDDQRVREALSNLLSSAGYLVATFASAAAFLAFEKPDYPGCLVLDLNLPGVSGLELQEQLAAAPAPPIVFITGHGDVPSTVRAMKKGAVEFLQKPFTETDLLRAIDAAIALDQTARLKRSELEILRERYALLTPRERDVLPLVVSGLLNKQTAAELGQMKGQMVAIEQASIQKKCGIQFQGPRPPGT